MKRYVLGFAFTKDMSSVLLIKKNKPEWQKGMYNGLGGAIEDAESIHAAMVREFKEESGIETDIIQWYYGLKMSGPDWECYVLYSKLDLDTLVDAEYYHCDEGTIVLHGMDSLPDKILPNLHWLLRFPFDPDTFSKMEINIVYT